MATEVIMPDLGLPLNEPAIVSVWFAEEGDAVTEGDRLVELLLNGTTFDLAAPESGTLVEVLAYPDDALQTGQVLALIEGELEPDAESAPS